MSLHKRISVGIASAATLSSAFSTVGYSKVLIEAPGTYSVYIQGSEDDSTYERLWDYSGASATVGIYSVNKTSNKGK